MSKEFTVTFTRKEVEWMYRRLGGAVRHAEEIINSLSGKSDIGEKAELALTAAQNDIEMLKTQHNELRSLIEGGMKQLGALNARREELEEQLSLTDEPHMKEKVQKDLDSLQTEEEYRVKMNRHSIKYMLEVVDMTINSIKTQVIPNYEKSPADHFETNEIPMSRSYYINKAWRDKVMLEDMYKRLEKRL